MNTPLPFTSKQADTLKQFLDAPGRSTDSMGYGEAVGFLFAVACAPEVVPPSSWLPVIIDPDNAEKASIENMQAIVNGLMSLYNEMNRQVSEVDVKLLPGFQFLNEPMDNLDSDAPISQWASGFRAGYLWLEKMWSDYTPAEAKEQFGYQLTVLCFFTSRSIATAILKDVKKDDLTLEGMATDMKRIFPDAMHGFALLGNSIQEVIATRNKSAKPPSSGALKVGRNDPCPCNSGKKYKKCCGLN